MAPKKTKAQQQIEARAVLADRSLELGHLGQHGELVSLYTATRAWRGGLIARTGEVAVLAAPNLVWTADAEGVNGKASKYFVRGKAPRGLQEEPSGARVVVVPISGLVYACAHGVEGPAGEPNPPIDLNLHGWPKVGSTCHYCTVTHEFRGHLRALEPGEWLELEDDDQQAMVNEISDGNFAAVLGGTARGEDHVQTRGIRIALHALTAVAVL